MIRLRTWRASYVVWRTWIQEKGCDFCVSPTIHVLWPNLSKIGRCEVAEKSSGIAYKKDTRPGHFLAPTPISPPLSRSRPKFRERCRLLTWVGVPTLDRIGCGLPDLFRKESKKVKTIIIGFQPTIFFYRASAHWRAMLYSNFVRPSVRLSVRLSVTFRYSIETTRHIVSFFTTR